MRASLALDDQICFALYSASRAVTRAYAELLKPLGLTYPQYLTLLVLWERAGVSVTDIGERLALDSGTLTPLLKRLEQQGLIRRVRSEEDARVVHVQLTQKGRALKAKAKAVPAALVCRTGHDLGDQKERAALVALRSKLTALTARLREAEEAPSPARAAPAASSPQRQDAAPSPATRRRAGSGRARPRGSARKSPSS